MLASKCHWRPIDLPKHSDVLRCVHMHHASEPLNMTNRSKKLTFHPSSEVKARLDILASRTRRSKSFLTNEAVERHLGGECPPSAPMEQFSMIA